jgi:hypothetical protein
LAPASPAATGVTSSQVSFSWSANGNPAGTRYTAQVSTASDFSGTITSSVTLNTSATIGSLIFNTAYFMRVKATGHNGTDTAFSVSASTTTDATPPDTLAGTVKTSGGAGINMIPVVIQDAGGNTAGQTTTASDGSWTVTGLTPGVYTVVATWTSANDVSSSISQEGHSTGVSGIALTLELSVTLAGISGTVMLGVPSSGPSGASLLASAGGGSGAYVELYQTGRLLGRASVDGQGRFSIPNLLPGRYAIRAYDGASFGALQRVELVEGQNASLTFLPELLDAKTFYFYPNPARSAATIRFETAVGSPEAEVQIFDLTGALVRDLPGSAAVRSGNEFSWTWDLADGGGRAVASGVYLVQLKLADPSSGRKTAATKKLAVVK